MILYAAILASAGTSQDKGKIKPLPADTSIENTGKWVVEAVSRSAGFKTERGVVSVSDVKFDACTLSFNLVKQYGSAEYATMGTTKNITSSKVSLSIDLKLISPEGIYLTPSLSPQTANLAFSRQKYDVPTSPLGVIAASDPGRVAEFEVKRGEAETVRSGLIRAAQVCRAGG
jgi:hypothetical protein